MARTESEVRKLIRDAWQMYERIPRVRETVDLHATAFALGRPLALLHGKSGPIQRAPVLVDEVLLREIGKRLYIAGAASANVHVENGSIRVDEGETIKFSFSEASSFSDVPPGELWSTATNFDAMMLMLDPRVLERNGPEAVTSILEPLLGSMLPLQLLKSDEAATLSATQVDYALVTFVSTVERMQTAFMRQLEECVGEQLDLWHFQWEGGLRDRDAEGVLGTMITLGMVYRVFLSQGIQLTRVRADILGLAQQSAELHLLPQSRLAAVFDTFGS